MSTLWNAFWNDQCGAIVTAEVGLLATLGVAGAFVGMRSAAKSVDAELKEVSSAFRSLDQSYSYRGFCSPHAATAGSCYQQPPVQQSLKELQQYQQQLEKKMSESDDKRRKENREERSEKGTEGRRDRGIK